MEEILVDSIPLMLILFFAVGLIATLIAVTTEVKKHRPVKTASSADKYITPGNAQMSVKEDVFLKTQTVKTKVASSNVASPTRSTSLPIKK